MDYQSAITLRFVLALCSIPSPCPCRTRSLYVRSLGLALLPVSYYYRNSGRANMATTTPSTAAVPTLVLRPGQDPTNVSNTTTTTSTTTISHPSVIIRLDETECKVLDTILAAANGFSSGQLVLPNKTQQQSRTTITNHELQHVDDKEQLQIRVAGGWVRDKVLGIQGYDIDIAIDSLSGVEFATLVQQYISSTTLTHKAPTMGVISANPSQSKHLETATMKVHGIDIDFCNLRSQELYEHDSRIPTTTFGSPYDDAERRDFTLNSLFYNIRTEQVEDWTGRGLDDLMNNKMIVTPLDPIKTLHDDPLRVLRAIRFAIRFSFSLHPDLESACCSSVIHKALMLKVSRERVGKELEGMLSGKGANPHDALDTMVRLGLAQSVFLIPNNVSGTLSGEFFHNEGGSSSLMEEEHIQRAWQESRRLLQLGTTVVIPSHQEIVSTTADATTVDQRLLVLAVFLLPFRGLNYMNDKSKQQMVVEYMMREGIKFNNKDLNGMRTIMNFVDAFCTLLKHAATDDVDVDSIPKRNGKITSRLDAGLLMRSTKELWSTTLLAATVLLLSETSNCKNTTSTVDSVLTLSQDVYIELVTTLDGIWRMKPLLDGNAIVKALDLPRGPTVASYLEEQVRWMLLHPNGIKEECLAHLMEYHEESQQKKLKMDPSFSC